MFFGNDTVVKGTLMTQASKGVVAILIACVVWGISPIYYKLLAHVPPLELLAHRTIWSLAFFGTVLAVQNRLHEIVQPIKDRSVLIKLLSASVMIAINWFFFISAVQLGYVTEASLGYFVYPLVTVVLGVIFFKERLDTIKKIAVGLASVGVLAFSVGTGAAPWIALILAFSFGTYSAIKKTISFGPVLTVAVEVLLLAPIAVWIVVFPDMVRPEAFQMNLTTLALLIGSGVLTGGPLVAFSYGAPKIDLATVGIMTYINPSLQFLCAVAIFAEPFGLWHMILFPTIWVALALYSYAALRASRKSSTTDAASGAT